MIHQANRVSEARRIMDQRLQGLPLVVDTVSRAPLSAWVGGVFVVAVFVTLLVVLP